MPHSHARMQELDEQFDRLEEKDQQTIYIYGLQDPRSKLIRYVGKSVKPHQRLQQHIRESMERQNTKKKVWIHQLAGEGLKPEIKILNYAVGEEAARANEQVQVDKYKDTIYNIHNPEKGKQDIEHE